MNRTDRAVDAPKEGLREPLFLIGFMGAGKTTVARELSALLGTEEIELDEEIVREIGMPIAEMFDRYGEEAFRDRETEALFRVAGRIPAVISCGGGCVLREENVRVMKESGTVVLLTAAPETVYARVKGQTERPILNGHMDVPYIASRMEERKAAYEAACDFRVSTDGKSPGEIAEEIMERIVEKI